MPINVIESVIKTNRSRELVSQIIPILISWAKLRLTNKTYGDLLSALGYTSYSGLEGNLEMWKLFYENFERVLEP